jgi:hypothetical protein
MRLSGFGTSQRARPNTFMNARFTSRIWPSGIDRQDSRNCYFIFASVGTKESSHHFIPGGSAAIAAGGRSLGHEHFYHSISEAQFKWMESGAILASSIFC